MSDDDCQIVDDNINYKSITCERIPDLFLDKLIAKKHFGKYGKISRFVLRPNRFCCTVDYEREEDATNAVENGNIFMGKEFDIRYSQREVGHVQNTEEWVDPDVQAELDAMGNHQRRISVPVAKLPPPAPKVVKHKAQRPAPEPAPVSQIAKVPNAVRGELEAILRKPAYSDEDRYRTLDARDKLIRLTTVRTTDINKAVSIKGTCPDMCPEKERYMREFQHQVSNFEMKEQGRRNEMDHKIAIKEYSRSSADQEVPLAHELRPEPVLKMTMLYLMHRIMGLCDIEDINIGDWFHFVWDRTRSIRKDITQQELCSTESVRLVEQCARFHIHCAARLVAEDPSVFDQKINTENLTKCLQTLKYMYNDLRLKGVRCEREAEFRGYIVLLNLNDANFLWELQQLPEEIQNSKQVRAAIAFYKCMESNNYVRFFSLVKSTTYMNACILLRYFTQVRLKALRMIIKAYNWPRHMVSLPLAYMTKILGFENDDAAADFFAYYGLECDQERVCLDKNAFEEPDVPVLMERAFELVESKREVGVGEAVCGLPLDSASIFESHQLQNSFDVNGYLRYESFNGEDLPRNEEIQKTPPRPAVDDVFKVPAPSPPLTPKQHLKSIFANISPKQDTGLKPLSVVAPPTGESIFNQKSTQPTGNTTTSPIFKYPSAAAPIFPSTTSLSVFGGSVFHQTSENKNIFGGYTQDSEPTKPTNNIFGTATQTFATDNVFQHFDTKPFEFDLIKSPQCDLDLERQVEEERQKKLQEEERYRRAQEEEKEKTQTRLREQEELERQRQLDIEHQNHQKRMEEKRRKAAITRVSKNSETILTELLEEVQNQQVRKIASIELQNHRRLQKLAESVIFEYISDFIQRTYSDELTIMRRDQSLLQRYFHSWRDLTHKKKIQRQLIAAIPVWMTTDTLEAQAEKLAHPKQVENLNMIKRYRLGYPCDFRPFLDENGHSRPIDIFLCFRNYFNETQNQLPTGFLKRKRYFKLIISLPDEREELPGFNSYANNWLEKNVERRTTDSSTAFVCHCENDFALCIRKVSCIIPIDERNRKVSNECDHADALLFLMSSGSPSNSRKRLHQLLKLSSIYRSIPIAIISYNSGDDFNVESNLDVESLMEEGKVSGFHVFNSSEYSLKGDFQKSLKFLAKNDKYTCTLEAQSVVGFLNLCLGDELWRRLYKSWSTNPSFRKITSTPRYLITIYNEAIVRLIEVIDEDFQDYPELPAELKPFVPPSQLDIPVELEQFPDNWKDVGRTQKLINFLGKLRLPPAKVNIPREIDELELWILNYTSECIPNNDELATKAGYYAIKCLIEEYNSENLQDIPVDQRLDYITWLPIIRQIALAVLNQHWQAESNQLPSEIVYNREEFLEYQSEPWWLDSESVKLVKMIADAEEENVAEETMDDDIEAIIARAEKVSSLADVKLKMLQCEAAPKEIDPALTRELDETLYQFEVNEKCKSFENAAGILIKDGEDSLELPPVAKKLKQSSDKMDADEIMERAFAILKRADGFMDCFRQPMKEVQSHELD